MLWLMATKTMGRMIGFHKGKESGARIFTPTPVRSAVNNTICIMYQRFRRNCDLPRMVALAAISMKNNTTQINSTVKVTVEDRTGRPNVNTVSGSGGQVFPVLEHQMGCSKKDKDKNTMTLNVRRKRMLCSIRCNDNRY